MKTFTLIVLLFCVGVALARNLQQAVLSLADRRSALLKREVYDDLCPPLYCHNAGGMCGANTTEPSINLCIGDSFCKDAVCTPQYQNGQACTDSDECLSGYCDGSCRVFPLWSTTCSIDGDCLGLKCINKRCVGASLGQPCDDNCTNVLEYCDGTCKLPSIQLGENCTSDEACVADLLCIPTTSGTTCQKPYSRGVNDACSSTDHCQEGLSCVQNMCKSIGASSNRACDTDADCPQYETCGCVLQQHICTVDYAKSYGMQDSYNIYACSSSKCSGKNSQECLQECLKPFCTSVQNRINYQLDLASGFPACYKPAYKKSLSTLLPPNCPSISAPLLVPSFLLLVVLLILWL